MAKHLTAHALAGLFVVLRLAAQNPQQTITIDAAANRHPISVSAGKSTMSRSPTRLWDPVSGFASGFQIFSWNAQLFEPDENLAVCYAALKATGLVGIPVMGLGLDFPDPALPDTLPQ